MRTSFLLAGLAKVLLLAASAAAAPKISVPASMSLSGQRVGVASAPHHLIVENTGDAPLSITEISFSGMDAGDFAAVSVARMDMPISVPAGGTRDIEFTFKPAMAGARSARIHLGSNDPLTPRSQTALSGTGLFATFEHSPMMLGFEKGRTGGCSAPKFVRIENRGTDRLRVREIRFEGMHATSWKSGAGAADVPAGGFLFIDVSLCPRAIGALAASLVIATDLLPDGGHKVEVPLSGSASGAVLEITPERIDFGEIYAGRASPPARVTIRNTGDEGTALSGVSISGSDAGVFTGTLPAAGVMVNPGAALSFDVTARPVDSMPRAAALVIALAEALVPGKQVSIPLSVTGITSTLSVSPLSPIDCGSALIGVPQRCPTEIIVRNPSERVVSGVMVGSSLHDFIPDRIPEMLMPMQSARVPLTFRPMLSGTRSATVSVLALGLVAAQKVMVVGHGQAVMLTVSPNEVDFGTIHVEPASEVLRDLSLINRGPVPLSIEASIEDEDGQPSDEVDLDHAAFEIMPDEVVGITLRLTPRRAGQKLMTLYLRHAGQPQIIDVVELRALVLGPLERESGEAPSCALAGGRRGAHAPSTAILPLLGLLILARRRRRSAPAP